MNEEPYNRVAENGEILPLEYEKLDTSPLVIAINKVLEDYKTYVKPNSLKIIEELFEYSNDVEDLVCLATLVAKSVEFKAKNGEDGTLEIEIEEFTLDKYNPKITIVLNVVFKNERVPKRSYVRISISPQSSKRSLYISSFLTSDFSDLGVGADVMKILIEISEKTKLNLSVIPTNGFENFYEKNGFGLWIDIFYLRNYWKKS